MVAALTAGWPLLSAALDTTTPVEEGSGVRLEAPSGADARLTVHGTGWELRAPDGVPGAGRTLALGTVRLEARLVVPAGDAAGDPAALPAALWNGLARVARIADPDTRLGEPSDTETLGGLPALTGPLEREGCTGTAWVVPAPDAVNAVQITATDCGTGDGDAPVELPPEVERTALSTGFPALRTEAAAPTPLVPAPVAAPRAPPVGVPAGALPTSPAPSSGVSGVSATASNGAPPGPHPAAPHPTPPPPPSVPLRATTGTAPGAGGPVRIAGPRPVDRPVIPGTTEAV
ncbi:hypothetical protein [Streptomyces sp. ST2-7A]|uniref:hypothetical protein n=1 Tax=Streptomyces sp. ST2-7A TaxID=2907214 RepID=UPI001F478764|nr:hypothetical protein [Streptomyces sp. ST2-7A]MCE7080518.1 hypothetical protein [Streptomyces sp. ST2-7A]